MSDQEKTSSELTEKVAAVIDQIRPMIQADGGDIELVGVSEATGVVTIRFQGACRGCPSAAITLKMGVERHVKEKIPEVKEVVAAD